MRGDIEDEMVANNIGTIAEIVTKMENPSCTKWDGKKIPYNTEILISRLRSAAELRL